MRRRDANAPEPPWVTALTDVQVVQQFAGLVKNPWFTYERIGRNSVDMRKRLLRLLLRGLSETTVSDPADKGDNSR